MSEQNKIDEIKEALAAATPGPWKFKVTRRKKGGDGDFCIGDLEQEQNPGEIILGAFFNEYGIPQIVAWKESNARFIAKAPEYITYLLQEIERLQGEVDPFWQQAAENQKENNLALLKKIERKDEALRFYADTKKYEQEEMWLDDDGLEKYWEEPEILGDGGKRAREAL